MKDKRTIQIVPFGSNLHKETLKLREEILRKPLGMKFSQADLDKEFDDIHIAMFDANKNILGCLVLSKGENKRIKMRQVAVKESEQKTGVGSLLVGFSEEWSREQHFNVIYCHARDNAVPFYLKHRYVKVGEPFTEVNIVHYKMEKTLK